jgi:hypothetical protein
MTMAHNRLLTLPLHHFAEIQEALQLPGKKLERPRSAA